MNTPNTHVTTSTQPYTDPTDLDDLYGVLKIHKSATPEVIKAAYRAAAMRYHPDRTAGDEKLSALFQAVQKAYDVLMDPSSRAYYDRTGKIKPDEAKLRDEAIGVLNANLIEAVDALAQSQDPGLEVWKINPVNEVRRKLTNDLQNARSNLQAINKAIKRYEAILKRFKSRKTVKLEQSAVGILMLQRLDNLRDSVDKIEMAITIHEQAIQMAADYDYDTAIPPEAQATMAQHLTAQQQATINQWFNASIGNQFPPRG